MIPFFWFFLSVFQRTIAIGLQYKDNAFFLIHKIFLTFFHFLSKKIFPKI